MPPRSTKAPKLTTDETTPARTSPGLRFVEELVTLLALRLLEVRTTAEDDVVAVLVELDDLALEGAAHERMEVADPAQVDKRGGEESPEPDVDDEPTLDDLDHRAGDDALGLLDLLDRPPGPLVLCALLREDEPAVLVLLLQDQGLQLVAEGHDLVRIDVVADRELLGGDDPLGLVPDVEEHLVAVDLDDEAGDDVAVFEGHDRGVDGVGERDVSEVVQHDRGEKVLGLIRRLGVPGVVGDPGVGGGGDRRVIGGGGALFLGRLS